MHERCPGSLIRHIPANFMHAADGLAAAAAP
jgi:hypothetical protein